jgi:hypothetical protein
MGTHNTYFLINLPTMRGIGFGKETLKREVESVFFICAERLKRKAGTVMHVE